MTLYYEEDIINAGGKISLIKRLHKGIFHDTYLTKITIGNIEILGTMKVYGNNSGKIYKLYRTDETSNEVSVGKAVRIKELVEYNAHDRQVLRKLAKAITATICAMAAGLLIRSGNTMPIGFAITTITFIPLSIGVDSIYSRGIPNIKGEQ